MISMRDPLSGLHQSATGPADAVLTGHSGARLTLHQSGERSIIRKMSGHPAGNARLRQQADKQEAFFAAGFQTPPVWRKGLSDGLFFFDMEYVPAISIAAQCSTGSLTSMDTLAEFVAGWIAHTKERSASFIDNGQVVAKIDAVVQSCRRNPVLSQAMPAIVLLGSALARVEWPAIPQGPCHGDMTLENILIDTSARLWLIDFDAPDLSSYWFDIAKLYQDLKGHWCLRHMSGHSHAPSRLNAYVAMRRLRGVVDEVVSASVPGVLDVIAPLVVLCLMRTLPYCKDVGTVVFVLERARSILTEPLNQL